MSVVYTLFYFVITTLVGLILIEIILDRRK
jgi:hypothetical protein